MESCRGKSVSCFLYIALPILQLLNTKVTYSLSYNKDDCRTKVLVYGLFFLNTLQSILLLRDGFITFAQGFGDVDGLQNSHLEWLSVPYITSIGRPLQTSDIRLVVAKTAFTGS